MAQATTPDLDLAANDLGPLAWVLDELRKSLENATKALRRYLRDAEAARGSDLSALDSSALRIARQQLHQSVGALEMVGLPGSSVVLRAMEAAVQKFVQKPESCNEASVTKVERASFAVVQYLEALLAGRQISPVTLFVQYRDVQELVAAPRIHPADLWDYNLRWANVPLSGGEDAAVSYAPEVRQAFDKAVLTWVKTGDNAAVKPLSEGALGLAMSHEPGHARSFWVATAAMFEAIGAGLLTNDVYVKRMPSRVLSQYASLAKGDLSVSDQLMVDVLFFCAQAVPTQDKPAPTLAAVRQVFGLARYQAVDYNASALGQFDPALLVQARKRISGAKTIWAAYAGGDTSRLKSVTDQFSLVSESLVKLHPDSKPLAAALNGAAEQAVRTGQAPAAELAMEVATAVLYLEAAFEDFDPAGGELTARTARLAQRLESVRNGKPSEPLEPWIEEVYRNVSEKQTMGSVVGELRVQLSELEKTMDQFFRAPSDVEPLRNVPSQLMQMRGVLSVLGLNDATQAVLRMRDQIETLLLPGADIAQARASGLFDKLGNNLGALGFLVDMLSYQPTFAKSLFTFDASVGELRPVMGRSAGADGDLPSASVTVSVASKVGSAAPATTVVSTAPPSTVSVPAVAAVAATAAAVSSVAGTVTASSAAASAGQGASVDAELRDIFLEEAQEVIGSGRAALQALAAQPGDMAEQTTLRRAFHTLKGSSRMVGLTEFGEAAWSMEQVLNAWLGEQKPFSDDLHHLCAQALDGFERWVRAITAGADGAWRAEPFRTSADALRVQGKYLVLSGLPADSDAAEHLAEAEGDVLLAAPEAARTEQPSFDLSIDASSSVDQTPGVASGVVVAAAAAGAAVTATDTSSGEVLGDLGGSAIAYVSRQTLTPVDQSEDLAHSDFDLSMFELGESDPLTEPRASDAAAAPVPVEQPADLSAFELSVAPDPSSNAAESGSDALSAFELAASPVATPGADEPAAAPAIEEIDLSAFLLEAQGAASATAHPPGEAASTVSPRTDFSATEPVGIAATPAPSLPESLGWDDFVLDAKPTSPDVNSQAASTTSETTDVAESGFASLGDRSITIPAIAAAAAGGIAAAVSPAVTAPPENRVSQVSPSAGYGDDQVKIIGPLRISIPLYNVYLSEADEWARRLSTAASEYVLEPSGPPPEAMHALAHSLGGSSATVGFVPLSDLARAMEHALSQMQMAGCGTPDLAQLLAQAAEEIRRLLHQFAAGFLKEADEKLQAALEAITASGVREVCGLNPQSATDSTPGSGLAPLTDSEWQSLASAELSAPSDGSASSAGRALSEQEALAAAFAKADQEARRVGERADPSFAPTSFVDSLSASMPAELGDMLAEPTSRNEPVADRSNAPKTRPAQGFAATEVAPLGELPPLNRDAPQPPSTGFDLLSGMAVLGAAAATGSVAAIASGPAELARKPAEAPSPPPPESAAGTAATTVTSTTTGSTVAAAQPLAPTRVVAQSAASFDDELDATDAVDADLFPIFEEEAIELMPQLSAALRQWQARPDNDSAKGEALRHLHTLKGSARLAGALRLGEMVHRMETEIERLPSDAQVGDIAPIVGHFDAIQQAFDALRQNDANAYAAAQALPTSLPESSASSAPSVTAAATDNSSVQTLAAQTPAPATVIASPGTSLAVGTVRQVAVRQQVGGAVRVRAQLLDRLLNQAGEVMITRTRLETELSQLRGSLNDLTANLERLRQNLRDIELQAETQMQSRLAQARESSENFDPLEFDRFTRFQEITRMMAESVNDVATVQRNIQRTVEATEDDLIAQARQTRELQRDLLRTRMVEFESISERLYRVVRQAAKDADKQVKLDILGGSIELDRGVLDRMTPAFEHLLRNCVAHGIETADQRAAAGKDATGLINITVAQEGNDVSVEFADDGAGLNLEKIRAKAIANGLIAADATITEAEAANLIFMPGFSTADSVSELAGRGIGMDVVRSEVVAIGGRLETRTTTGKGSSFKLIMPLTTAVTQVVMLRCGKLTIGVPANVVEIVRRATQKELEQAYNSGVYNYAGEDIGFFWSGALLQASHASTEPQAKYTPVVVFRSAAQRVCLHVDEVLGNQEVVVKNLGPQLSRLPGLAGMSVLASGAVILIYNPVALATVYGPQARAMSADKAQPHVLEATGAEERTSSQPADVTSDAPAEPVVAVRAKPEIPLVMVVDDSITVRRVTQRLLQREGYRVVLAADGLQALEKLPDELPSVVLSDIEMPRMDGFDLLRNIRGDANYKHLPVIMITSRIAEKHREHAIELGVNHYLGKPYSEEELLSLVRRYCFEEQAEQPAS